MLHTMGVLEKLQEYFHAVSSQKEIKVFNQLDWSWDDDVIDAGKTYWNIKIENRILTNFNVDKPEQ